MKRYLYVFSLLFVFAIPAAIQGYFVISKIPIVNLLIFIVIITFVGSLWDIWATRHGRYDREWLWQFNTQDTLALHVFGLPIEEYFFYTISSLYVIFTWEAIKWAIAEPQNTLNFVIPILGCWSLFAIAISATSKHVKKLDHKT